MNPYLRFLFYDEKKIVLYRHERFQSIRRLFLFQYNFSTFFWRKRLVRMIKLDINLGRTQQMGFRKKTHRLPFGFLFISFSTDSSFSCWFGVYLYTCKIACEFEFLFGTHTIRIRIPLHAAKIKVFYQGEFDEWIWEILPTIEIILRAWNFKRLSCAQPKKFQQKCRICDMNVHMPNRRMESYFPQKPPLRIVFNFTRQIWHLKFIAFINCLQITFFSCFHLMQLDCIAVILPHDVEKFGTIWWRIRGNFVQENAG